MENDLTVQTERPGYAVKVAPKLTTKPSHKAPIAKVTNLKEKN